MDPLPKTKIVSIQAVDPLSKTKIVSIQAMDPLPKPKIVSIQAMDPLLLVLRRSRKTVPGSVFRLDLDGN